jgi:predicted nucleic acid-binding protein
MKGLDTPVLLEILEGGPSARKLLESLEGQEVCTTEANLLELVAVARRLGSAGLAARLAALDHLRRGLTVLALDSKAAGAAAARWKEKSAEQPTLSWLIAGALEAAGCTEWITDRVGSLPAVSPRLRITRRSI